MTNPVRIRKGFDIRLAGAPRPELAEGPASPTVAIHPASFSGVRPRMRVQEGDTVQRGTPLFEDKNSDLLFGSPAGGKVARIVLGERRSLQRVVIEVADGEEAESFTSFQADELRGAPREKILEVLQQTGYIALICQRPFSGIADPQAKPKAIFVNGMNTAPFTPDLHVAVQGEEAAFQAGLDALGRLTEGEVHLCLDADAPHPAEAVTGAERVTIHTFRGPHPAGNTSVHIHHIDPIRPHDVVWTVRGVDVPLLGRLLLDGQLPTHRVISLGGPAVRDEARGYYRVRIGGELAPLLDGRLDEGREVRVIEGDVLTGEGAPADGYLALRTVALNALHEDRERHFLGWIMPGLMQYSHTRLFLSTWLRRRRRWDLGTNRHGGDRAMVVTGLYDRFLPMRIRVDYLVRAVLANDVEEAVQLGLLELDPEDLALCAFACPSKTDLVGILRDGLRAVETEGI